MARKTQLAAHGGEKPLVRRSMRTMAGETSVFTRDRFMLVGDSRARIFMAREAQLIPGFDEQRRLLRGMGVMTFQARTVFERFMLNGAAPGQILRIVAVTTQLTVFCRRIKSIAVRWSVVARLAFGAHDRIMRAGPEERGLRRRMGVVADRAGFLLDRILPVCLFEGAVAALVAGHTELRWSHRQEIALRRRVRKMTFPTPLLRHHPVLDFVSEISFFVAFGADCITFGTQEIR